MIAGIILSAGKSERMGRPKALLPFRKSTFLEHLYRILNESSLGAVRVVLGAQAERILAEIPLPPGEVVINLDYEKGMLSSLQAGLNSLLNLEPEGVMVFPVDHPDISLPLIENMIKEFRSSQAQIVIPAYRGRRGHPVLFGKAVFGELLRAPLDKGARHVVHKFPEKVLEIDTDYPGILADIDTPEDYRNLTP